MSPRLRVAASNLLPAALLLLAATFARGEEAAWYWLVEPAFMRPPFAEAVAGSRATVTAPGRLRGEVMEYVPAAEAPQVDLAAVRATARENAAAALATLEPEIVRDERGVALYARLDSERPVVAAAVLAPGFVDRFRETLGPDLLVAIPNRHRAYVYPALASRFAETAPLVLRDYELSASPVSREVFRVTETGLRAEGTFDPRP